MVSIWSALRKDDEKKVISVLSIIRSSDSYMLQKINEMYITDQNKITLHLWTKSGEFYKNNLAPDDIVDEIIHEESH